MHLSTLPAGVIGGGCGMQTLQKPAFQVGQMHALISCTTQARIGFSTGAVYSNIKGNTMKRNVHYLLTCFVLFWRRILMSSEPEELLDIVRGTSTLGNSCLT